MHHADRTWSDAWGRGALAAIGALAVGAGCFVSLGERKASPDSDAGAGAGLDASADAGTDGAGGTTARCFGYEPEGAFCDSFDDPSMRSWWIPEHSAAGAPTIDRTVARSSPGSLAATIPPGGGTAFSRLVVVPPAKGFSRFRFRFAVRVDEGLAYTELAILHLEDTPTLLRRLVFFVTSDNTLRMTEFRERTDGAMVTATLGALRKNEWDEVEVDGQADGVVRGSLNGVNVLSMPLTVAKGRAAEGAALRIGTFMATERSRARTFHFDDFAFRVDP